MFSALCLLLLFFFSIFFSGSYIAYNEIPHYRPNVAKHELCTQSCKMSKLHPTENQG